MVDQHLAHYGVKGMKWGQRKSDLPGVSGRTNREARKDAEEFTRAKLFYGEGAGTRRKLIKNTVEAKARKDPNYKKAFDHHVSNTDLGKRASQARSERRRKDTSNSVRKTVRGVSHIMNGNSQYASAAAAMAVGGYMYARKTGIDKAVMNAGKQFVSNINPNNNSYKQAASFLKDMGL